VSRLYNHVLYTHLGCFQSRLDAVLAKGSALARDTCLRKIGTDTLLIPNDHHVLDSPRMLCDLELALLMPLNQLRRRLIKWRRPYSRTSHALASQPPTYRLGSASLRPAALILNWRCNRRLRGQWILIEINSPNACGHFAVRSSIFWGYFQWRISFYCFQDCHVIWNDLKL
jgi:hypothetical protein